MTGARGQNFGSCSPAGLRGVAWSFVVGWLVLVAATGLARGASGAEERFDMAARLYEQGRFSEAAELYVGLRAEGVVTPALLLNEGNAWFQSGSVGRAITCYRGALRLAPRDGEIRSALTRARARAAAGGAPAPPVSVWRQALDWLRPNEWAVLALMAGWGAGLGQAFRAWRPAIRKDGKGAAGGSGAGWVALALALLMAALVTGRRDPASEAIVVQPVDAHFGPLPESQVAFSLADGAELRVIDRKGGWVRVLDTTGRSGWIDSARLAWGAGLGG